MSIGKFSSTPGGVHSSISMVFLDNQIKYSSINERSSNNDLDVVGIDEVQLASSKDDKKSAYN